MSRTLTRTDETETSTASGAEADDSDAERARTVDPATAALTDGSVDHEDESETDRPRASTVMATTAVAFAVGATAIDATYAVPVLLLGGIGLAVGVVTRRRPVLDYSTGLALASVLLHGAMGGGALGSLVAAGLVVFAWDQADHALDLDAHLGTDADVTRGEVAHALYSFAVVALAGGGAYALAILAASRRPLPALVLLLLGAVLLTASLRHH